MIPGTQPKHVSKTPEPLRIMGLDPGLRYTGWGVIEVLGSKLSHIAHGTISVPASKDLDLRLKQIHTELAKIVESFQPHGAAVEETFLNKNPSTTLKLGLARGVVMVVPTIYGIRVGEYSANKVKKTVVGAGHADKDQVKTMVKYLLPSVSDLNYDEADALAVAICHSHYVNTNQQWMQAVGSKAKAG